MKIKIEDIYDSPVTPGSFGHVVTGTIDGVKHHLFRRTTMPVSGGTSVPPHNVAREFYDDFLLYREAEGVLKSASEQDPKGFLFTGAGATQNYAHFDSVEVVGPNMVEVKATIDSPTQEGEERTVNITGDQFKQLWQQSVALEQPAYFVGGIAQKFAETKEQTHLQDYLGEFVIDESTSRPPELYSKNFAQPVLPQTRLVKSGAATAKGNYQKVVSGHVEEGENPEQIQPENEQPQEGQQTPQTKVEEPVGTPA